MAVIRKIYRQGNSFVVSLPQYMIEKIGVNPDTRRVKLDFTPGMWITIEPHADKVRDGPTDA